jgi:hypothetical protein
VVGGDPDVAGAFLDHLQQRIEYADSLHRKGAGQEVAEQLVGAIDTVNDHGGQISRLRRTAVRVVLHLYQQFTDP